MSLSSEEPSPRKKRRNTPVSALKSSKKKTKSTKRVQIQARPVYRSQTSRRGVSNNHRKRNNRGLLAALTALSKKVLYPKEISFNSDVVSNSTSLLKSLMYSQHEGHPDLHSIASEVVTLHNKDPNAAQCALLNLLFRSIGGSLETNLDPSEHSLEELDDEDWGRIITDLVDEMRSATLDKVLLCVNRNDSESSTGVLEFKRIYCKFWDTLAHVALQEGSLASSTNSITGDGNDSNADLHTTSSESKSQSSFLRFDVDLVRDLILRITELVSVGQPDVRASATMAALCMAESIISQSYILKGKIATTLRYLNAAKGAKKKETLAYQLESLERTHDNLVEVVLGPIMQGIFIHRYRDSNPTIRCICQNSLSNMSLNRPDLLLTDQYLKYFGWLLSDPDANVRVAAVSALLAPLERHKLQNQHASKFRDTPEIKLEVLEHVVMKFLNRMADCVIDRDKRVQLQAMKLLLHLLKEGFLDNVDDEDLWNQINVRAIADDTTPEVRMYALYFVIEQLEPFDNGVDDENDLPIDAQQRGIQIPAKMARQRIDSVATWLAHTLSDGPVPLDKIHITLADHLVDSLRAMPEHSSLVLDWSALLTAIADDKVATLDGITADDRVDVAKQKVLIQMLSTAVSSSMGENRTNKNSGTQDKLCATLMQYLPRMITGFKSDSSILANLSILPSALGVSFV